MTNKNIEVISSNETLKKLVYKNLNSVNFLFQTAFIYYDSGYKIDENIYDIIDDRDYEFEDVFSFVEDFVIEEDKKYVLTHIWNNEYDKIYFKIKTPVTVKNVEFIKLNKKMDDYQICGLIRTVPEDSINELDLEIFVKEIHHRIKNTLQILNSLLSLDIRFNKDDPEKTLRLTQHRLKALSLVYKNAYGTQLLSDCVIKSFIPELLDYLESEYPEINDIAFVDEISVVRVSMDIITPIALIIVEVIDNIVRSAHNHHELSNLQINLISKSEDNCSLIIKSDVSSFNFNDIDSFGITLINMLLDQIDATIDLDSNSNCSINFCTVLT